MFDLKSVNIQEIATIEYHFEDENLDLEIQDPTSFEISDDNHIITDYSGCIFIIQPMWVYISIIKRKIN